eukprot:gnl/TRDRNA2_/TRDRNA2_69044_c0_seq1.p2 gnl/TRDRNA2_/TRDRNA2_69044_c0~~gnl/TRDRNA2_/TRDRNA2_69044_c0_seq1.p2  ORF type:complete len:110 (-),score=13.06 gnl/TRDRNA2_/TRDRNA2_69044_c0_seq1:133-462(-)
MTPNLVLSAPPLCAENWSFSASDLGAELRRHLCSISLKQGAQQLHAPTGPSRGGNGRVGWAGSQRAAASYLAGVVLALQLSGSSCAADGAVGPFGRRGVFSVQKAALTS